MRRTRIVLLVIVICLMLAGCITFQVKNTDGLRAAYEKIELAYPLAAEIGARQDLEAQRRQALIDTYNEAKASVNSLLYDVKQKSVEVVDFPKEAFETDEASQKIDKFISDAEASRPSRATPSAVPETEGYGLPSAIPGLGYEAAEFAMGIVEAIWRLHKEDQQEAYERFMKIIDANKMVEFDQVPAKLKQQ